MIECTNGDRHPRWYDTYNREGLRMQGQRNRRKPVLTDQQDLTGQTFGHWTILAPSDKRSHWRCRCECGTEREYVRWWIVYGLTPNSCGCHHASLRDLTGHVFGRLTVLRFARRHRRTNGAITIYWTTQCACGKQKDIRSANLTRGIATSCGCYATEARTAWSKANIPHGSLHPCWNPLLTDEERRKQRNRPNDAQAIAWRTSVFQRDDFRCVNCAVRTNSLVAHHKDAWASFPDRRYDVTNGVTLCDPCHRTFHRLYGKGKNTEAQFVAFRSGP